MLLLDIDEDDLAELLLDFAELLDFGATLEEDDFALTLEEDFALDEEFDFTELLLASSQSSHTLDEESSPGRTKLLSSSSQAASAKVNARANTRRTDPRRSLSRPTCRDPDDCRNAVTT